LVLDIVGGLPSVVSTGSGIAVARAGMARMACARMESFISIVLNEKVE
jgi:hypothetical protein